MYPGFPLEFAKFYNKENPFISRGKSSTSNYNLNKFNATVRPCVYLGFREYITGSR